MNGEQGEVDADGSLSILLLSQNLGGIAPHRLIDCARHHFEWSQGRCKQCMGLGHIVTEIRQAASERNVAGHRIA